MKIKEQIVAMPDDTEVLVQHTFDRNDEGQATKAPVTYKMAASDLKALAASHTRLLEAAKAPVLAYKEWEATGIMSGGAVMLADLMNAVEEAEQL